MSLNLVRGLTNHQPSLSVMTNHTRARLTTLGHDQSGPPPGPRPNLATTHEPAAHTAQRPNLQCIATLSASDQAQRQHYGATSAMKRLFHCRLDASGTCARTLAPTLDARGAHRIPGCLDCGILKLRVHSTSIRICALLTATGNR